jgi:2-polyprenyl-3-methyl-5-hydroxy-6-metoxy-1,4-benzoquinol methylase
MAQEPRKDFDKEAAQWDANPGRVKLAHDAAAAIMREVRLSKEMEALDFGCGTGLLTLKLQPHLKSITGVDSSPGMLSMLERKVATQKLDNVHTRHIDFEKGAHVNGGYDLIVSSMVVHHVPDTADLFKEWFDLLHPNGQIAFADLDSEDGSFHGDNTGVFHLGFDRSKLRQLLQDAGFQDIRDTTATTMSKEVPGQGIREFPIFLIVASKRK